jgi:hypothetical protein
MTKFKVGDAVVLTNPGTRYTGTDCDTSQVRVSFMNVLLQYTNNKTHPGSTTVHDKFIDAANLLSGNWSNHGIVVAVDPVLRLGTRAYAVEFTNFASSVKACCVFGENGLEAYIHTSVNKNSKSITKQDILLMMEKAYKKGQLEHRESYHANLRVLEIFDEFANRSFGAPMTFTDDTAYKEYDVPF